MDHADVFAWRMRFMAERILIAFNGPFSQSIIEEIGVAIRGHLSPTAGTPQIVMDVFASYIEMSQNISHYVARAEIPGDHRAATMVIRLRDDTHYDVMSGNVVRVGDGPALVARITALDTLSGAALKALYKEQLRKPRAAGEVSGAGLGLIDLARRAWVPPSCDLQPIDAEFLFFTLHIVV
jgi:hypothetical protein